MLAKSQEQYYNEVKEIYGDKYIYSDINYKNNKTMITIICRIHGKFVKRADSFRKGSGCQGCFYEHKALLHRKCNEDFIKELQQIYGNKYDYSKVKYKNTYTKVKIICPEHGEIMKTPKTLLQNNLCWKCKNRNTRTFIKDSQQIHGNYYDYKYSEYISNNSKVLIICPKHKQFWQEARNHLRGSGCPICKCSKGERCISQYLQSLEIKYEYQIRIKQNNSVMIFDFYIPLLKLYIEYDGKQHFQNSLYGTYDIVHKRDMRKDKYIIKNNLTLLRIHYKDMDIINELLTKTWLENINYSRKNYYSSQHIQTAGNP